VPAAPAKVIPVKKETKAPVAEKLEPKAEEVPTVKRTETEKKPLPVKDSKASAAEPQKAVLPPKLEKTPKPESTCPLCKTELNAGSQDPPNFNTCTECKNQVCNLCGFNPTPHLTEIQEWLCLNCQTQRAISGQLGDMGKMPPTPSGPKASPMPVPPAQPSQKTAMPPQVKMKKKEQEVKTEAEQVIPEKVKEIPSVEKIVPKVTTDHKQESQLEEDKTSAPQEKKPPPEDKKPLPEEKMPPLEEKKPTSEDKKPAPEDKKLPPATKPSALEAEQKQDLLKTHVPSTEEEPEGRAAPQLVPEKPPQTKTEAAPSGLPPGLPKEGDEATQKMKGQQQAARTAKPEPGREKNRKGSKLVVRKSSKKERGAPPARPRKCMGNLKAGPENLHQ